MAEFVCKVGDTTGRVFQQVETAQSEDEARQKLAERGFYVFSVRSHLNLLAQISGSGRDRAIRPHDFLIFNQQFHTLVKAGLPILKALDLLAERAAAVRLRPILAEVRQRVREGALLSEALAAQGSFPPVYITVIAAGERSGNLTGVLEQYIAYLRVSTGFRTRLLTSLIYPSVLVLTAVLVVAYVVTYALPQFASLYQELNVPLPAPTRILLSIAIPLRAYFIGLVIALAAAAIFIFLWTRSDRGALAVDRMKPRVPILGDIWLKAEIAQFVRTLSTLLSGGTPLVPALHTSAAAIGSKLVSTSVEHAAQRVKEGEALHASLSETRLIPGLALEMIEVGEASGALPAMLTSVAEFYEEEVSTSLERTLSLIPIVILVVMAVVIGFLLISLYLPMFSLQVR
ncbi:MAG TPA: type II secretion system F family protein [Candidatus Baltobacteraceae bacterium]|jgi:type IV pilus assembly protein PilC|nr:type II secretion system F family protein [Candidatus Baltobacteraceae bacterium]